MRKPFALVFGVTLALSGLTGRAAELEILFSAPASPDQLVLAAPGRLAGILVDTNDDRAVLPPGWRLEGPAVVEEFGSTTVVFPGQTLEVDPHGILIVRRS